MSAVSFPVAVANGAITPPAAALRIPRFMGFAIAESSGSATAKVRIRDLNVSGQILATINLAAGESVRDWFGSGLAVPSEQLYVQVVSGAVEGSVYVGV